MDAWNKRRRRTDEERPYSSNEPSPTPAANRPRIPLRYYRQQRIASPLNNTSVFRRNPFSRKSGSISQGPLYKNPNDALVGSSNEPPNASPVPPPARGKQTSHPSSQAPRPTPTLFGPRDSRRNSQQGDRHEEKKMKKTKRDSAVAFAEQRPRDEPTTASKPPVSGSNRPKPSGNERSSHLPASEKPLPPLPLQISPNKSQRRGEAVASAGNARAQPPTASLAGSDGTPRSDANADDGGADGRTRKVKRKAIVPAVPAEDRAKELDLNVDEYHQISERLSRRREEYRRSNKRQSWRGDPTIRRVQSKLQRL